LQFYALYINKHMSCPIRDKTAKDVLKEMFEGTKGVIRSRKSKNDRQYYGQKKKRRVERNV